MKKPEEIKKGMECCSTGCADDCFDCPYGDAEIGRVDDHCIEQLLRDSLARNQQLEKRIIHLEALNQQNLSVITMQERTRARLEERISQLEPVKALVSQYISEQHITCSEDIWQRDKPQEEAIMLVDNLCKLVGYMEETDE